MKSEIKTAKIIPSIVVLWYCLLGMGISQLTGASQKMVLEDYISQVLTNGKDIKLARKELETAGAVKKEALATALPKFQLTAGYNRNLSDVYMYIELPGLGFDTGEQKFKINYKNEFSFQAVVNQPLFSLQIGTALKAAKEYKKLTDLGYQATRDTLCKMAKKIFYQTLLLQSVWQVRQASETNAYDNYVLMKKRFDHGQISRFQLLQAESRWHSHIPETTEAKKNYNLALNSWKMFADLALDEEVEPAGSLETLPALPEKVKLDSALSRRPDYNALIWQEKLQQSAIRSEKGKRKPTLDLNVIYHYSSMSEKFKMERENNAFIVGLSLNFPIYTGGYVEAQVHKARIELDKTRLRIEKEKDAISKDMSNIQLRLVEATQRREAAEKSLETARKAFEIAEVTAANGLATQLELKDARLYLDQAKLGCLKAAHDYLAAYFDWEYAVGKR